MNRAAFLVAPPVSLRGTPTNVTCTRPVKVVMRLRRNVRYNDSFRRDRRTYDPDPKSVPSFSTSSNPDTTSDEIQEPSTSLKEQHMLEESQRVDSGNGVPPSGGGDDSEGSGPNWGDDSENQESEEAPGQKVRETVADDEVKRLKEVYSIPVLGALARRWPALRFRLMANARLPLQMGVELCIGFTTKTMAEVRGRGERFWKEFDFYLSDIALELFGDAMLVWLLSPVALAGGAVRALPRHAGQVGNFLLGERIVAFIWKGVQFGTVGFTSSMVGHGLTSWLVKARNASGHKIGDVTLAPVIPNSLAWGSFLMVSSNSRYQAVNCIEQRVLDRFLVGNGMLLGLVTFALRAGNSYFGSAQWLPWAKQWGLQ
ncbi:Protein RETICULATA-RELATED 4, chloroplastic [Gracilariopsis chorda]|uniref:Protein RETICULATA-RELATED 4, chloroplastic n=1 Tax=Gracilariopsis chorda TaxID=448386 RepID=A0A2V3J508_9FLOR|nr:Protein RETICULATA-RELATED 4, chloroplastic [Gracilariopsis chorda]|eukprot:PXF48460.1 Protein RETICULATA-RELATED 4, chloroplastic [Gracilariopsis chorda]